MKKLIFIDNDDIQRSKKDVENYVIPALEVYAELTKEYLASIEIISDLYQKDKDELYELFYSGKNAILSWSVYTPTSFHNSNQQLLHFLRVAGTADVKDVVYLDMSGMVCEALCKLKFNDTKNLFQILTAIERNKIITLDGSKFVMLKLDLASNSVFKKEVVSLPELLM